MIEANQAIPPPEGAAPADSEGGGTTSRSLRVAKTVHPSPSFVRITLEGPGLGGFANCGPRDHVALTVPATNSAVLRHYTLRAFRPGAEGGFPQVDLDFFAHHADGPAARWAGAALASHELVVAGPHAAPPVPAGLRRVILGADESALPAFARWIELLPDSVEILGFVQLRNESDAAYLEPSHVNRARVVYLGERGSGLGSALRRLGPIGEDSFVWIAGEAASVLPIRRYLRHELAVPEKRMAVDGYWKRETHRAGGTGSVGADPS